MFEKESEVGSEINERSREKNHNERKKRKMDRLDAKKASKKDEVMGESWRGRPNPLGQIYRTHYGQKMTIWLNISKIIRPKMTIRLNLPNIINYLQSSLFTSNS